MFSLIGFLMPPLFHGIILYCLIKIVWFFTMKSPILCYFLDEEQYFNADSNAIYPHVICAAATEEELNAICG